MESQTSIIKLIIKEKENISPENEEQIENRVKYLFDIVNEILENLKLSEFINDYKSGNYKPFNDEWIDFYKLLLDIYIYNGTTEENNPDRKSIRYKPQTVDNSFDCFRLKIAEKIIIAISNGKDPEIYLEKFLRSSFESAGHIFLYQEIIRENVNKIIDILQTYGTLDDVSKVLNEIQNIINSFIKISDDECKITLSLDFRFKEKTINNPIELMKEMEDSDVLKYLTTKIQEENIKYKLDKYFDLISDKYNKGSYERSIADLESFNKKLDDIVKNKSLPISFSSLHELPVNIIISVLKTNKSKY